MITDKVILGNNYICSTDSHHTGLNNNILVCGGSGSGKTMSVTEPRLLETFHSNLIVTLTKRRLIAKYTPLLRQRGYEVLDLNLVTPSESTVCYDPLAYVKTPSDITFLAEAIVKSNPRKDRSSSDPYFDDAAVSLLAAEIAYIQDADPSADFTDVLNLHNSIDFFERGGVICTSLDDKFVQLMRREPNSFAVCCWKSFKRLPIKTAGCVFSTLNTTLDTLFPPELKTMMKQGKSIDFQQIATQKTVLFISTSAVNPALHNFSTLFYSQAFKQLFEYAESLPDGELPIPFHIICDDFAIGSRMRNFAEYISVFREKRISVTLMLQSETQLRSLYGADDAMTIINCCDTYLYMGGMDLTTAREVSLRANTPLNEILSLPVGQIIIFRRGQPPVRTTRYDILHDERYSETVAQNIRS